MTNTEERLNIKGIIQHFGGRTTLHRLLKKHGITVSIKTVEMWAFRSSIPANRLAALVKIAGLIGKPLELSEFFGPVKNA